MPGGEAPPRMLPDPALKRRAAGAEGAGALRKPMHFRASAFVPPKGMGAGDTARCRICLQSDLCSELVKPCGCKHLDKRSAYAHLSCILRWISWDAKQREGGCKICKQEWKFHEEGKLRASELEASGREDEPKQDREILLALEVIFLYLWSRVRFHTATPKEEILLLEAGLQRPGPWTTWVNRTLEKQNSLFSYPTPSMSMGDMRLEMRAGSRPGSRRGSDAGIAGPVGLPLVPTGVTGLPRRIRRSSTLRDRGAGPFLADREASSSVPGEGSSSRKASHESGGGGAQREKEAPLSKGADAAGGYRSTTLVASTSGGSLKLLNVANPDTFPRAGGGARGDRTRGSGVDASPAAAAAEGGGDVDAYTAVASAHAGRIVSEAIQEAGGSLAEHSEQSPAVARRGSAKENTKAGVDEVTGALCWVCSIDGEIFDLHETCECTGANQFAHVDCWKSWVQERKTQILKSQCPDCMTRWKLMHHLQEQEAHPVFDKHTGAEIKDCGDARARGTESPPVKDIENALTILFSRVKGNNLTPRNKDLLRLVGSQFPGEWTKWIKQQVAQRRRNRLSVSGPAEELTPVEPPNSAEGKDSEEEKPRRPSIVDFIPFLHRRKSFAGFKTERQAENGSDDHEKRLMRHAKTMTKARDRQSMPSLSEDSSQDMPDRRRSILTYAPEPCREPDGGEVAVSASQVDLETRLAEKQRRGSNIGIFGSRHKPAVGESIPQRKGSILNVFSKFSRRFSVSVKKKGLFGRRITQKQKTPTRLRIEADGEREAWEDNAPALGHDVYEAEMEVTCFCCYSAKPDLR